MEGGIPPVRRNVSELNRRVWLFQPVRAASELAGVARSGKREFSRKMGYKKLGVAFFGGLHKVANAF